MNKISSLIYKKTRQLSKLPGTKIIINFNLQLLLQYLSNENIIQSRALLYADW
jgi:hypothetical protein